MTCSNKLLECLYDLVYVASPSGSGNCKKLFFRQSLRECCRVLKSQEKS